MNGLRLFLLLAQTPEAILEEHMRSGDYEGIIRVLDSLYAETKDPKYLSQEIDYMVNQGFCKKAMQKAEEGMRRHPDTSLFYQHALRLSFHYGSERKTRSLAEKIVRRFPEDPGALHLAAMVFDNLGLKDDAEKAYLKAEEMAPDSPGILVDYVSFLVRYDRPREALELCPRAEMLVERAESLSIEGEGISGLLNIAETSYRLQLVWGLAHDKLNGYEDAKHHYGLALEEKEGDKVVSLKLAEIYLKEGKPDSAIAVLESAMLYNRADPGLMKVMGLALYQNEDYQSSLAYLGGASVLNPDDDQIHYYMARCLFELKKPAEAMREIDIAVRLNPSPTNLVYKGFLQIYTGYMDEGSRTLLAVADQGSPDAFSLLGTAMEIKGKNRLAEKYYRKAAEAAPRDRGKAQRLMSFLRSRGKEKEIESLLRRQTEIAPRDPYAWYELAMWHSEYGDLAVSDYAFSQTESLILSDTAWTEDQNTVNFLAGVLNNWAYTLAERGGDLEKAKKLSQRAQELSPDNPVYLDTHAWIYFKMGDKEKARAYIERALSLLEKPDPEIYGHAAQIYRAIGMEDKAKEYEEKAREAELKQ
ncbi:MAG: tetratricopeptide repeat protein [candidate division WOR-3 bacterium]